MRFLRRRAISNIIATILIFAMMVVAMGVLYSRIAPVAIGFEAESSATNQEFIFLNIKNELDHLVSSSQGARSNIHITSTSTAYDLNVTKPRLSLDLVMGATVQTVTNDLGLFEAKISRSFQEVSTSRFLGNNLAEFTLVNTKDTDFQSSAVIYFDVSTSYAVVSMYYRASVSLVQLSANVYALNIFTYTLTTNPSSPISDFPISLDEWTLSLLRGQTTKTNPFNLTSGTETSFTMRQSVSRYSLRNPGIPLDTYTFGITAGSTVMVNNINVPIYFGI